MEKETKTIRKKPKFRRKDYHKKIKLGSNNLRKVKWKAPKGRQNKTRLGKAGNAQRPNIGWGSDKKTKGTILGKAFTRIENLKQLELLKTGSAILIASVGKKKREEIIKKAAEMKIIILNKYKNVEKK